MTEISRRTLVKGAAWSLPVIAVATAVPLAAASVIEPERFPAECVRIEDNHGHGGAPGNKDWWQGVYSDGTTTEPMSNGEAMSSTEWGDLCRAAKKRHG